MRRSHDDCYAIDPRGVGGVLDDHLGLDVGHRPDHLRDPGDLPLDRLPVGEGLLVTALDHLDLIRGKVLSRRMKAAKIEDLLNVWVEEKGGRWEKITGRPGDREDEFLIGEIELPFTRALELEGIEHFLISFNEPVAVPVAQPLSSANAERLDRSEMTALIQGHPE